MDEHEIRLRAEILRDPFAAIEAAKDDMTVEELQALLAILMPIYLRKRRN